MKAAIESNGIISMSSIFGTVDTEKLYRESEIANITRVTFRDESEGGVIGYYRQWSYALHCIYYQSLKPLPSVKDGEKKSNFSLL